MGEIRKRLVDAYATLIIGEEYLLNEKNRTEDNEETGFVDERPVVPPSFTEQVEIRVAHRTIEALSGKE